MENLGFFCGWVASTRQGRAPQTRQCPTGLIVGRVGREPESSEFYLSLEAVLKFTVVAVENHCVWILLWSYPQVLGGAQYSLPYSVFK